MRAVIIITYSIINIYMYLQLNFWAVISLNALCLHCSNTVDVCKLVLLNGKLGVMRVVTSQWGLTRPSSIYFSLDIVRDVVPHVQADISNDIFFSWLKIFHRGFSVDNGIDKHDHRGCFLNPIITKKVSREFFFLYWHDWH